MSNSKGLGILRNRMQTAELFGIAKTTLDEWVRRGCPVEQRGSRGKEWVFNSAAVASWREGQIRAEQTGVQHADVAELMRRKLQAETAAAELALAKAAELVAPIEQTERALAKAFGEVRAQLRNVLPSRLAKSLAGLTDETEIKGKVTAEVDLILTALADGDLVNETDLELDDDLEDLDDDELE